MNVIEHLKLTLVGQPTITELLSLNKAATWHILSPSFPLIEFPATFMMHCTNTNLFN